MQQITIGKKTIFFDDANDWHKFTDQQGNKVESVTTFTSVISKPALIDWAVRMAKEYLISKIDNGEQITVLDIEEAGRQHRKKKEEAGNIGQQIHEIVSKWIKKEPYEIPEDDRVRNGFDAFLKFQKEHKVKWLESERICYSAKNNYAGILDAIGIFGKKLTLIDIKSSSGIWPEMALQVAGYQIAWEEETKKKIEKRMIVRFDRDNGSFEYRELPNDKQDKEAFLACVTLKRALNGK